ncbi:amino acid permease [bacterium]|jgi:glutamate:GABA antiporter|nr:amino acid permease [bacterium]MBT4551931.1 amino acid permease [bacterium]
MNKKKSLSIFVLAMMNVAVIMSLRGLPMMAKEGTGMVFYLFFAAVVFLIPTALVSAELATTWSDGGGVYRWVGEAFGHRWGFVAVWLQWIQNVIWYPTILAFTGGALAYLFLAPELANSKLYTLLVVLIVFWGATILNFFGLKLSGIITTSGVVLGTIIPGIVIIIFGAIWWFSGYPIAFMAEPQSIIPDFSSFNNLAFLAGIVLLFAGMEVSSVHALEVKDPKKDYPKAILIAVVIIIVIFTLSSFAISAVLPAAKISLTVGFMQALQAMLAHFQLLWLLPLFGFVIAFGAIAGVIAWIIGPSKGLYATAKDGYLPALLQYTNKKDVPVVILLIQAIIVTVLALLYLFMPDVNTAYFILTALTAILYLIMYILLFAAAIRLRYSKPDVVRAYKVPGGNFGMWLVSGIGILGAIFAIIVGLYPPAQLAIGNPLFYVGFIITGIIIFVLPPIIIFELKK